MRLLRVLSIAGLVARTSMALHQLYDVPVSNHGARVRLILKAKGIESLFNIESPAALGGLKSEAYLKLNPQGKMPLLVTSADSEGTNQLVLPESDTICRYILEKYAENAPSFVPKDIGLKYLSETIVRTHDIYITNIQGCMYKAPGTVFSTFGTDRRAALSELKKQLLIIESSIEMFHERSGTCSSKGPFLCGSEISLADATLFPTMVFCDFMLPQFFNTPREEFTGKILSDWFDHMSMNVPAGMVIKEEIVGALDGWKNNGRWAPILEELKSA